MVLVPVAAAQSADTAGTLYVSQASGCSDSGAGTQAVPFCTIQAAANVVNPGQTVNVAPSVNSYQPVTITRSGTPSAPITFVGALPQSGNNSHIVASTGAAITLQNVHDVTFSSLQAISNGNTDGVDVIGSQDITLDSLFIIHPAGTIGSTSAIGVAVDAASSAVTVSRSRIQDYYTAGVQAASGAQDVTVTTNLLEIRAGTAISLDGAGGDVTGNTVDVICGTGASITGGSTATVENNILMVIGTTCTAPGAALSVDAPSAGNVRADYNALFTAGTNTKYSWAGTAYATAAAFAVTGQGAHDVDMTQISVLAPNQASLIDSGDCAAPGELATDLYGNPRVRDPQVQPTGTGTCYADRGAIELQDTLGLSIAITPGVQGPAPFTAGLTVLPVSQPSAWGETVTYSVDFGDGSGSQPARVGQPVTHTYTTPGQYTLKATASDTGGSTKTLQQQITVGPPTSAVAVGVEGGDQAMWVQAPQLGSGWHSLGGNIVAPPAVAAAPNPNGTTPAQPLFLATGGTGKLYIRSLAAGWQPVGPVGVFCVGGPAAVITGGTLTVACRGTDNALWENSAPVPSSGLPQFTRPWTSLGGYLTAGAAVAPVRGVVTFFAAGSGGRIYVRTLASGFAATSWWCTGSPAAAAGAVSGQTIFGCVGGGNALWEAVNSGTGWGSTVSLGGSLTGGPAIAATSAAPVLLAEGSSKNDVLERTSATSWTSLGGYAVGGVGAVALN
jgi:PKD repeat protein